MPFCSKRAIHTKWQLIAPKRRFLVNKFEGKNEMINEVSIGNANQHCTNVSTTNSAATSSSFGCRVVCVVQDVVGFFVDILKAAFRIVRDLLRDVSVEVHIESAPQRRTFRYIPRRTVPHFTPYFSNCQEIYYERIPTCAPVRCSRPRVCLQF